MIDAMPAILERCPDAVYVVLGATHPNLVRSHGEAYRDRLAQRARDLGVEHHVVFLRPFRRPADAAGLYFHGDVYVTPYLTRTR